MIDWSSVLQVAGGLALVWLLCACLVAAPAPPRRVAGNPDRGQAYRPLQARITQWRSRHG